MRMLRVPHLLLIGLAAIALSACSGGAATTANPNDQAPSVPPPTPVRRPASADVQAFKVNLWQNINTPQPLRQLPQGRRPVAACSRAPMTSTWPTTPR